VRAVLPLTSDLSDALKTRDTDFRQKSGEELSQLGDELAVEYFNFDPANRIILNAIEAGSLGTRFGLDHGLRGWQRRLFSAHFTMALEGK
jgi:hypothetical protein